MNNIGSRDASASKNESKMKEGHYTSNNTEKITDQSCKIQFVSSILLHDQGDRTTPITLWAHFEHTQRSPRQLNTLYGYHTWDCVRMKTIQNSPNAKSAVFSLKNFSALSKTYIFQISDICNSVRNINQHKENDYDIGSGVVISDLRV